MPEDDATQNNQPDLYPDEIYKELVEAGVFYGRKKTKTHPRIKPYVLMERNNMTIVNLDKTLEGLNSALDFLKEKVRNGAHLLLVATQPAAQDVSKLAEELNLPLVTNRWLGGLLTNFKVISKRIEYFKKLRSDLKSGALDKYTKKERLMVERELKRLEGLLGGVENMEVHPDILIMIDPNMHTTAVREANRLKIPIIAFANTDSDPDLIDFPVVGNNKGRKSINWFLEKIAGAIREAKLSPPTDVMSNHNSQAIAEPIK